MLDLIIGLIGEIKCRWYCTESDANRFPADRSKTRLD